MKLSSDHYPIFIMNEDPPQTEDAPTAGADRDKGCKVMEQAFASALIPFTLRDKAVTLESAVPEGDRFAIFAKTDLAAWAKKGGRLIHIASDAPGCVEAAYLLARSAIRRGISAIALPLPFLAETLENKAFTEATEDRGLLLVPGFAGDYYKRPVNEETSLRIEWILRHWLLQGRALLLQGATRLEDCKWWSPDFLKFLQSKMTREFLAGYKGRGITK